MNRRAFIKAILGITAVGAIPIIGNSCRERQLFFTEMTFGIDKSRALKAEYTMELAQDLTVEHGLDAEIELEKILSAEILVEINSELC